MATLGGTDEGRSVPEDGLLGLELLEAALEVVEDRAEDAPQQGEEEEQT